MFTRCRMSSVRPPNDVIAVFHKGRSSRPVGSARLFSQRAVYSWVARCGKVVAVRDVNNCGCAGNVSRDQGAPERNEAIQIVPRRANDRTEGGRRTRASFEQKKGES